MSAHSTSSIDNCKVIDLPKHSGSDGALSVAQNDDHYPFRIQRAFYLYDVPADSERGGHSHHRAQELIIAVSGSFDVTLHDGRRQRTFHLDRPYRALYICAGIWRTLDNFSSGSVCLVLTSELFDEQDYVRDFDRFLALSAHKDYDTARFPFLDLATVNAPYMPAIKQALCDVVDSGRYIGGDHVKALEQNLRRLTGATYAIGVSNGLDALRLIFRGYIATGHLCPGDEVLVPANTYIASILAVTDAGLTPVFVEPDPNTMNIDPKRIPQAITPRTRALLTVHLYGRPAWDRDMSDICRRHNLLVIEDNAQAIGATTRCPGVYGSHVTGALGHAAAFSFYPTKNIGALGDAGAVTTYDKALASVISALRNYGSDTRYHNIYQGFNCRLDPIQAAVINIKLTDLDNITARRQALAQVYNKCIKNPEVKLPLYSKHSVWHQYVVQVNNRDHFRKYLLDNGVQTDVHYATPPHRQPCYAMYADLCLPVTDMLAQRVVSLPVSDCTSVDDAHLIAQIINNYKI